MISKGRNNLTIITTHNQVLKPNWSNQEGMKGITPKELKQDSQDIRLACLTFLELRIVNHYHQLDQLKKDNKCSSMLFNLLNR